VAPTGPTLTQNPDGSLTFQSAATGVFHFDYTVTGAAQEVTAFDGTAGDQFGASVAIDGTTAVVGAPRHQGPASVNKGSPVYVFTLSGSTWSLQQQLFAGDSSINNDFGSSVAIQGDTLVVGADNHEAAYVFTRSRSTWSQQAELQPSPLNPI